MSASGPSGPLALNYDVFLFFKVVLILANSADPDETQQYATFHLGLHYLPKYPYTCILRVKTIALRKMPSKMKV